MLEQVDYVVEGLPDAAIAVRVLSSVGLAPGRPFITGGKQTLLRRFPGYVNAARFSPWLVVLDQDDEPGCPGEIVARLMPEPSNHMNLRIAVREIESWILADKRGVASYLGVSAEHLPHRPDDLDDPKAFLVQLAERCRRRQVREALVPRRGSGRKVGPEYATTLAQFAEEQWSVTDAAERSPSLARALDRLTAYRAANAP